MPDYHEPSEAEEWAAMDQHLTNIHNEETAKLMGSSAIHQTLKETGIMQTTTKLTEALFDQQPTAAINESHPPLSEAFLHEGYAGTPVAHDVVGVSETVEVNLSPEKVAVLQDAKTKLGLGDDVTLEDMVEATKTPIKPLTKKQQKQQKHMMKNMQKSMKQYQRQGQAAHIMNKLFACSIRTPEQARQVHATQLAKAEIIGALGQRQSDAFFGANPDTKCHDFFPKATIEANPTLMTDLQGQSRTLAQVYEYYIYKHFMLLTKEAEAAVVVPLDTEVNWDGMAIPEYRATGFIAETPAPTLIDTAPEDTLQWGTKEFAVGEVVTLTKAQVDQFSTNIALQHGAEGREVPEATTKYLDELNEKAA